MASNRASIEFPTLSVETIAELEQIETGALDDGSIAYVVGTDSFYRLRKADVTTVVPTSVRPTKNSANGTRAGRWFLGVDTMPVFEVHATTTDATPIDVLAISDVPESTLYSSVVSGSAIDEAGGQVAAQFDIRLIYNIGGVVTIVPGGAVATPVFVPNVAPWNTITVELVAVGTNVFVRFMGIAATTIDWTTTIQVRAMASAT